MCTVPGLVRPAEAQFQTEEGLAYGGYSYLLRYRSDVCFGIISQVKQIIDVAANNCFKKFPTLTRGSKTKKKCQCFLKRARDLAFGGPWAR